MLVPEILVYRQRVGGWAHVTGQQANGLTRKFLAIDAFTSHAIALSKVTALQHKVGNHAMEIRVFKAKALLSCAQSTEVFGRLGDDIGTESHLDAAGFSVADTDIEEAL